LNVQLNYLSKTYWRLTLPTWKVIPVVAVWWGFRGGKAAATNFIDQPAKLPFFAFILVDDFVNTRGRGVRLALWSQGDRHFQAHIS